MMTSRGQMSSKVQLSNKSKEPIALSHKSRVTTGTAALTQITATRSRREQAVKVTVHLKEPTNTKAWTPFRSCVSGTCNELRRLAPPQTKEMWHRPRSQSRRMRPTSL